MTEQQELEICTLWKQGVHKKVLRDQYHIKYEHINDILDRHNVIAPEAKKNRMKCDEKMKNEWDIVTACLRGEITKRRARAFCRGKIPYEKAVRR